MMVGYWRKCVLVLHKHLQVRMYHYVLTTLEIVLPIILSLLVAFLKVYEYDYLEFVEPNKFGKDGPKEDRYFEPEEPLSAFVDVALGENVSVFYYPDNWYTESLIRYSNRHLQMLQNTTVKFYGFNNKETLINGEWKIDVIPHFLVFFYNTFANDELPYVLHYNLTVQKTHDAWLGTVAVAIQHLIALHFMGEVKGHDPLNDVTFTTQRFPLPKPDKQGTFIYTLSSYYCGYLVPICFIFTAPVFLAQVVMEKQRGIKELMRVMGLPVSIQWFGFFVDTFVVMFISSLFVVLLMTSSYIFSDAEAIIKKTGAGHLLIIFTLYILSSIAFYLFLSTLFNDATRAALLGLCIYCATFSLPFLLTEPGVVGALSMYEKLMFSLLPNMALFYSLRFVAYQERQNGLEWGFYLSSPTLAEDIFLLPLLCMFVMDIILYWFGGWYLDQLFPGPYGISRTWYFLCTGSYWKCNCQRATNNNDSSQSSVGGNFFQRKFQAYINPVLQRLHLRTDTIYNTVSVEEANFESEPEYSPKVVIADKLTKVFSSLFNPPFVAADKVSFNIYQNEIFVLLGHNGAGKTVTMSMITGTYNPTSGTAYIFGFDIRSQINQTRESLGFCPQAAMFFPELSVEQHFKFFGRLKGLQGNALDNETVDFLHKLKLWKERGKRGRHLSGGMLRRLQLGMAIIGKVQFIVLDEPSSGLDLQSRRVMWDLLLEMRNKCCILLSTHNMEEADAIGDRIAIMAHSKVVCCGSPMFLRSRYGGTNYVMKITKSVGCESSKVLKTVLRYVPTATIGSESHTEISIILPISYKKAYPSLFDDLEKKMDKLNISNFGLSTIGLEEIFIKVNELVEEKRGLTTELQADEQNASFNMERLETKPQLPTSAGKRLYWQQFQGLLMKRLYYVHHRAGFFFCQFVIIVVTSVTVILIVNKSYNEDIITSLLEKVFTGKRKLVVFEYHTTTKLCLPEAYISNMPKHVEIRRVTGSNLSETLINTAKADILGFEYAHFLLAVSFTEGRNGTVLANAMYYGDIDWVNVYIKTASLNLVHNAVLKNCGKEQRIITVDIEIADVKLAGDRNGTAMPNDEFVFRFLQSSTAGIFLAVGLGVLCSCFVFLVTHERLTQAKHIQLMTGVSILLYWVSAFVFDYVFYFLCICCCIIILTVFAGSSVLSVPIVPGIIFLAMLLFGWCAIPFAYFTSFFPRSTTIAYVVVLVVHLASAVGVGAAYEAIFTYYRKKGDPAPVALTMLSILLELLPGGCLSVIFLKVFMLALFEQAKNCWFLCSDYMEMAEGGVGRQLLMLWVSGVMYMLLVLLLEIRAPKFFRFVAGCFICIGGKTIAPEEDEDVEAESVRVKSALACRLNDTQETKISSASEDVLLVHDLTKHWSRQVVSVDHLTFGVRRDECFGLLGVNGAGKTTTFRMLTGSLVTSGGNAFLLDVNLLDNQKGFLYQIGYCPQFDAVIDHLTVRNTLLVFSRLRGINESEIQPFVDTYLKEFGLKEYAYKITMNCSLGTKRKLSTALAFFGSPILVLLDEPTTGVDPASRRKIWEVILSSKDAGTGLILASHSMDECEVLCTRLAIMKNGHFKCIGPVQHLKSKFGTGFKVNIKLPKTYSRKAQIVTTFQVMEFMEHKFKDSTLGDEHESLLVYSVPYASTNWQKLFLTMDEAKTKFSLDDYSVCQATLEEVFLAFASD